MLNESKKSWWWLTLGCCLVSLLAASLAAQAQVRQPVAEIIALVGKAEIKSPGKLNSVRPRCRISSIPRIKSVPWQIPGQALFPG